uniref:B30.2/SPRY domain-containing protein n=1 Tax=Erpetoichthys calabaricus TaxID=27687 RepID=A0A8C4SZH2_ERPCA
MEEVRGETTQGGRAVTQRDTRGAWWALVCRNKNSKVRSEHELFDVFVFLMFRSFKECKCVVVFLKSPDFLTVTDNPKRFDCWGNVLAREGFTSGRHYWEVEVGGKTAWDLGVARESVNRKGHDPLTPYDGYWTVWLRNENEYKALDYNDVILPLRVKPQTVGVFLDYDEGQVSFYNAQSRSHLYTFTDSFTEPLYPFFGPDLNDGGKNAALLVICPLRTH